MNDKPKNMSELFEKLEDLKTVFSYGQKIIPILQSLMDFMKDTVPLLENINKSIDQTAKQFPKAQDQINDISSATEIATTQILDKVDEITNDLIAADEELKGLLDTARTRDEKIDALIKNHPELANELSQLKLNGSKEIIEKHINTLGKINQNTYSITLSLQVQDITSQQLAAVNHLINSVQTKLSSLIKDIDESELEYVDANLDTAVTFDEDASFTKTESNQDFADELFAEKPEEKPSQEEIDKLFSSEL
ncbi:MAG: hypothetical protein D6830_00485 [Ignavibacteria bacterium]|nr:MAG: hypothetical protein D6830_00485 [Ignavibacteria bacterium]